MPGMATEPDAPRAQSPADLDNILASFVGGGDAPAQAAAPAAGGGGQNKAWLDAMLSDFVSDDPFKSKKIRGTAKIHHYSCNGLDEVQLVGLLKHQARGLDELTRLSNLDEKIVRKLVEGFQDRGLVELV